MEVLSCVGVLYVSVVWLQLSLLQCALITWYQVPNAVHIVQWFVVYFCITCLFFFLLNVRHFTRTLLEKLMRSLQINGMKSVQMCALETKRIRLWRAAMPSSALYRRLKEFYEGDVGFVNTAGVIYYKDWCGIKVPVSDQYNWQNEILAVCSSNIFLKKKKSAHHVCFKRVSFFLFFFLNPAASAVRPASGFWSKLVLESIKKKKKEIPQYHNFSLFCELWWSTLRDCNYQGYF